MKVECANRLNVRIMKTWWLSYIFSGIQIFHIIDVDVAQQNETFRMVWMVFDELI